MYCVANVLPFIQLHMLEKMSGKVSIIRNNYVCTLCIFKLHFCITWLSQHPVQGCNDDYISLLWPLEYGCFYSHYFIQNLLETGVQFSQDYSSLLTLLYMSSSSVCSSFMWGREKELTILFFGDNGLLKNADLFISHHMRDCGIHLLLPC